MPTFCCIRMLPNLSIPQFILIPNDCLVSIIQLSTFHSELGLDHFLQTFIWLYCSNFCVWQYIGQILFSVNNRDSMMTLFGKTIQQQISVIWCVLSLFNVSNMFKKPASGWVQTIKSVSFGPEPVQICDVLHLQASNLQLYPTTLEFYTAWLDPSVPLFGNAFPDFPYIFAPRYFTVKNIILTLVCQCLFWCIGRLHIE